MIKCKRKLVKPNYLENLKQIENNFKYWHKQANFAIAVGWVTYRIQICMNFKISFLYLFPFLAHCLF